MGFISILSVMVFTLSFCVKKASGFSHEWEKNTIEYMDVHNHLAGRAELMNGERIDDFPGAGKMALRAMKRFGIKKMFVMPPPFSPDHSNIYDYKSLISVLKQYPERFAFLGGGGTLNVMIQKTVKTGIITNTIRERFSQVAHDIASSGAVGFGEFAMEHLSFAANHPYEYAPPDHPLFLLLADISAKTGLPIDIHMEAVPEEMPLPERFRSPPNPRTLKANIDAFERLLSHNLKAKIIWSHVGWCNTGKRTPRLCEKLLLKHPNLYMSFKISPRDSVSKLMPLEAGNGIRPEWLDLIKRYPDRFLIGSDHFYVSPMMPIRRIGPPSVGPTNRFFRLLNENLGKKIGIENPENIFNLNSVD